MSLMYCGVLQCWQQAPCFHNGDEKKTASSSSSPPEAPPSSSSLSEAPSSSAASASSPPEAPPPPSSLPPDGPAPSAPPPPPDSTGGGLFANLRQSLRLGTARPKLNPARALLAELKSGRAALEEKKGSRTQQETPSNPFSDESEFRAKLLQQKKKLKDVETEVKYAPLEVQLQGYGRRWTQFLPEEPEPATPTAELSASQVQHNDLLLALRHPEQEGIQVCPIPIPGEVWLLIYRFLWPGEHLRLESTCKDLLTLGYLWDSWPLTISLSKYAGAVTNHVIQSRFSCLATNEGIPEQRRYHFNLSDTKVAEPGIRAIVDVPIERLDLNRCFELPDNAFSQLSATWPSTLHTLSMEGCLSLSDAVLRDVGRLSSLTSLNLCYIKAVTDQGIRELATLTQLKRLDLTHSRIADVGLHDLVRGASSIDTLILSECRRIVHLRALVGLPNLQRLELNDMSQLTDAVLREALSTMSALTALNLGSCQVTNETVASLTNCPNLTALDLTRCKVSQIGLAALRVPLRSLDLSSISFSRQAEDVPRLGFLVNFPQLTSLNLAHCEGIVDSDLTHLAHLTSLTFLSLRHHSNITDKGILSFRGLPLTQLDLTYCSRITGEGLLAVLSPSLTSLSLAHCKLLTDDALEKLVAALPNLKELDAANCVLVQRPIPPLLSARRSTN